MDYVELASSLELASDEFRRLSIVMKHATEDELDESTIKRNIKDRLRDIADDAEIEEVN